MKNLTATKLYTLAFGLFLGLCIWKFGNPVILDHKISAPVTPSEFLNDPWPLHWANWILLPLVFGALICSGALRAPTKNNLQNVRRSQTAATTKWLWLLPLVWLGWQFASATQTVDADLTRATLWQFSGCVACYFLGARIFSRDNLWRWLLPGLLAAFAFCLIRGIEQRLFEFPQDRLVLLAGERAGWTNFPPETVMQMKTDQVIITTNGTDIANPVILDKLEKGRVAGTLIYPNALAGIILLLWPVALALAFGSTKSLKPAIRFAVIALTQILGGAALVWSGSKLGWLIAIGLASLFLMRLDWPRKLKLLAVSVVLIFGLGIFSTRFHHYFQNGATSAGARLDYCRVAMQTTATHPLFGTGPGTFQRPYAEIKPLDSEMARLVHNDYLEQFSDSGLVGGLAYVAWIFLAMSAACEKLGRKDTVKFALLAGLLGWFSQGIGEFELYIPALAWTSFTLLGCNIVREASCRCAEQRL